MFQRLLQVLYVIEFLIALIAVYTVWREIGGSGHLDYMPWYWKALIGFPAAYVTVRITKSIVAGDTWRMTMWILALTALGATAGILTYYTHLNEPQDEDEEDPGSITPAAVLRVDFARSLGESRSRYERPLRGV
jgi:hypothetical protein